MKLIRILQALRRLNTGLKGVLVLLNTDQTAPCPPFTMAKKNKSNYPDRNNNQAERFQLERDEALRDIIILEKQFVKKITDFASECAELKERNLNLLNAVNEFQPRKFLGFKYYVKK